MAVWGKDQRQALCILVERVPDVRRRLTIFNSLFDSHLKANKRPYGLKATAFGAQWSERLASKSRRLFEGVYYEPFIAADVARKRYWEAEIEAAHIVLFQHSISDYPSKRKQMTANVKRSSTWQQITAITTNDLEAEHVSQAPSTVSATDQAEDTAPQACTPIVSKTSTSNGTDAFTYSIVTSIWEFGADASAYSTITSIWEYT